MLRSSCSHLGVVRDREEIAFGYASGAISILSDGFHSLTDAASNVAGLSAVRGRSRLIKIIHTATERQRLLRRPRSMVSAAALVIEAP